VDALDPSARCLVDEALRDFGFGAADDHSTEASEPRVGEDVECDALRSRNCRISHDVHKGFGHFAPQATSDYTR
jgi:hypothetical protein